MDKWEYCYVDISGSSITYFTKAGISKVKIKKEKEFKDKTKEAATGRAISQLGLDGWELVNGVGNSVKLLYFKRKIG